MDHLDHVTSVIAIMACKLIRKLITKIDFCHERVIKSILLHFIVIVTREQVATRSCVTICLSTLDTNDIFCSLHTES